MTFLLDVNVLIAMIDPAHLSHDTAHRWFADEGAGSWATCPITENGVIRIISHPNYPNTPGPPAIVASVVTSLRNQSGHNFWPDDISLFDEAYIETGKLLSHRQVTDSYLLALAIAHGGRLASFDTRLQVAGVRGAKDGLLLVGRA